MLIMEHSNSEKKFRKAQKLDPKLPDAYGDLGCAYGMSRQFEEAMTFMKEGAERWCDEHSLPWMVVSTEMITCVSYCC